MDFSQWVYCPKCNDTGIACKEQCSCQDAVDESFNRVQIAHYRDDVCGPGGWTTLYRDLGDRELRAIMDGTFGYCRKDKIIYRKDKHPKCPGSSCLKTRCL